MLVLEHRWTVEKLKNAQSIDTDDRASVIHSLKNGERPKDDEASDWPVAAYKYLASWDSLKWDDNPHWREWYNNRERVENY